MTTIDISKLYAATGQAKLSELENYKSSAMAQMTPGDDVTLTGPGPVWMYLYLAHALHGKARSLTYTSPVTGPVTIFNHNPN